jgi:hypothetical protein
MQTHEVVEVSLLHSRQRLGLGQVRLMSRLQQVRVRSIKVELCHPAEDLGGRAQIVDKAVQCVH